MGHEAIEIHTALSPVGRSTAKNNRRDVRFIPIRNFDLRTRSMMVTRAHNDNRLIDTFRDVLVKTSRRWTGVAAPANSAVPDPESPRKPSLASRPGAA